MGCTEPTSDIDVALPFDSSKLILASPTERRGTISAIDHLTEHIAKLTVQLADDELLGSAAGLEAGRYVQIQVSRRGGQVEIPGTNSGTACCVPPRGPTCRTGTGPSSSSSTSASTASCPAA